MVIYAFLLNFVPHLYLVRYKKSAFIEHIAQAAYTLDNGEQP